MNEVVCACMCVCVYLFACIYIYIYIYIIYIYTYIYIYIYCSIKCREAGAGPLCEIVTGMNWICNIALGKSNK